MDFHPSDDPTIAQLRSIISHLLSVLGVRILLILYHHDYNYLYS